MTTNTEALPPLPEPRTLSRGDEDGRIQLGYTADQMRAFAIEAMRPALADAARWRKVRAKGPHLIVTGWWLGTWNLTPEQMDAAADALEDAPRAAPG